LEGTKKRQLIFGYTTYRIAIAHAIYVQCKKRVKSIAASWCLKIFISQNSYSIHRSLGRNSRMLSKKFKWI